jgi:hypothetical protein
MNFYFDHPKNKYPFINEVLKIRFTLIKLKRFPQYAVTAPVIYYYLIKNKEYQSLPAPCVKALHYDLSYILPPDIMPLPPTQKEINDLKAGTFLPFNKRGFLKHLPLLYDDIQEALETISTNENIPEEKINTTQIYDYLATYKNFPRNFSINRDTLRNIKNRILNFKRNYLNLLKKEGYHE